MVKRPFRTPAPRRPVAAGLLAALAACGGAERPTRIVLVTFDTLRWDRFDGEHSAMPLTAAAARGGLVFEDFYAATSSTQPTHATLFTGRHPWQHGVPRNGAVLTEDAVTVAERLQASGYHTAAVVGSFPLHSKFGFDQGFDEYFDDFDQNERAQSWNEFDVEHGFYNLAGRVTDVGLGLLDGAPAGHQLLWLHYYDPHSPYGDTDGAGEVVGLGAVLQAIEETPSLSGALVARALAAYDRDVAALDRAVTRVLERLAADADRWETHVLLTADHGESFGEEGSMGHGKRLIRSQVQVPLVLLSPRVEPGRRTETAGSLDVPTTILSLAGLPPLPGTSGRDLTRPIEEAAPLFGMRRTFVEPFRDVRTSGEAVMVHGPWFYCVRDKRLHIGDAETLVVEGGAALDDSAADDLRGFFRAFAAELEGRDVEELVDPETQRRLEALGYRR